MQNRMKTHMLSHEQIENLLNKSITGTVATINSDGSPYVTPIHFVYDGKCIYFHGLPKGQKIENIKNNPNVSFNVYNMDCLLFDENEKPCDTNTKYQSVIIQGQAYVTDDFDLKKEILNKIVDKYTPSLSGKVLPEAMVRGTAVIKVEIKEISGKFYE